MAKLVAEDRPSTARGARYDTAPYLKLVKTFKAGKRESSRIEADKGEKLSVEVSRVRTACKVVGGVKVSKTRVNGTDAWYIVRVKTNK